MLYANDAATYGANHHSTSSSALSASALANVSAMKGASKSLPSMPNFCAPPLQWSPARMTPLACADASSSCCTEGRAACCEKVLLLTLHRSVLCTGFCRLEADYHLHSWCFDRNDFHLCHPSCDYHYRRLL